VVSALVGVLAFKEVTAKRSLLVLGFSTAIVVLGACMLGTYGPP
jgi:hypothetical protein